MTQSGKTFASHQAFLNNFLDEDGHSLEEIEKVFENMFQDFHNFKQVVKTLQSIKSGIQELFEPEYIFDSTIPEHKVKQLASIILCEIEIYVISYGTLEQFNYLYDNNYFGAFDPHFHRKYADILTRLYNNQHLEFIDTLTKLHEKNIRINDRSSTIRQFILAIGNTHNIENEIRFLMQHYPVAFSPSTTWIALKPITMTYELMDILISNGMSFENDFTISRVYNIIFSDSFRLNFKKAYSPEKIFEFVKWLDKYHFDFSQKVPKTNNALVFDLMRFASDKDQREFWDFLKQKIPTQDLSNYKRTKFYQKYEKNTQETPKPTSQIVEKIIVESD